MPELSRCRSSQQSLPAPTAAAEILLLPLTHLPLIIISVEGLEAEGGGGVLKQEQRSLEAHDCSLKLVLDTNMLKVARQPIVWKFITHTTRAALYRVYIDPF